MKPGDPARCPRCDGDLDHNARPLSCLKCGWVVMAATASYFRLVRRFPLITITTDRQYQAACNFLWAFTARHLPADLDAGQHAYVATLACLIDEYRER